MSQVSCDITSLPNSLHGDSQLEPTSLLTLSAGQSERSCPAPHTVLLHQDGTLTVPHTWSPSHGRHKSPPPKDETLQGSAAAGRDRPPEGKTSQNSAAEGKERVPENENPPGPAAKQQESPPEDETLQSSPAKGKETPPEDETPLLKPISSEGHFPKTPANSALMSTPDTITCQPRTESPLPKLVLGKPSACAPLLQKGPVVISEPGRVKGGAGNGVLPPVPAAVYRSQKPHGKLQSHPSLNSQSSKRSKGSSRSSSSQVQSAAQEGCCVHCILACLFCEFLMLCNIALDCATCGACSSDESCFCCCCGAGECADCDVPCDMDCGIVDACCESADCLEICMECCGLCFSS